MFNRILILEDEAGSSSDVDTAYSINVDAGPVSEPDGNSENNGLVIDKVSYTVHLDGEQISFPKKEFELLLLLASNPGKVFRRDHILSELWGADDNKKGSRSLDVHIRMIRKKLNERFITTVRGVGYKLLKTGH
jgi:two-component system alkaline phosphatase synthesis response regulator PhoP